MAEYFKPLPPLSDKTVRVYAILFRRSRGSSALLYIVSRDARVLVRALPSLVSLIRASSLLGCEEDLSEVIDFQSTDLLMAWKDFPEIQRGLPMILLQFDIETPWEDGRETPEGLELSTRLIATAIEEILLQAGATAVSWEVKVQDDD